MTEALAAFLEQNLPKVKKKKAKFALGVLDKAFAQSIQDTLEFPCRADDAVREIVRGVRLHHVLEAGTRVRLYYPMKAHEGSVYMAAATVDAITAQFSLLWVRVYEDNVAGKPLRFVSNFEV